MDRLAKIALISGIVILIATVALEVYGILTTPGMFIGFYLLFFAFIQARRSRKGEVLDDERTWKVLSNSLAFSCIVIYAAVVVTYMLIKNDSPLLSIDIDILFIVFNVVILFSIIVGSIYFSRRGLR